MFHQITSEYWNLGPILAIDDVVSKWYLNTKIEFKINLNS
jgi:hypothetical protein